MARLNLLILLVACVAGIYPVESMSRWFSASFQDLRFALRRYGHCVSELAPIRDYTLNETDFLIHQVRVFLDQGNYDNNQLSNVTALMDNVCRSDIDTSYPISVHIDVNKYNGAAGKENRCRAVEEALESMYHVFRRAALNRSEPLDFSVIQFHPNATDRTATYNLTDLINTSWIKSETILEHVCKITESVKEYVQTRSSASVTEKRVDQRSFIGSMVEFLDRLLDPIFGLQKRLFWEGTNRLEQIQSRVNYGYVSLRDGFYSRVRTTRDQVSNFFVSNTNSTSMAMNSTSANFNSSQPINLNGALKLRNQTISAVNVTSNTSNK